MASFASSGFSNVTKPKPRDLLVSRSLITSTFVMLPYLENACSSESSLVSKLRPPTKSFPSSDILKYLR
uniref:Uncharacterized protein n=1 Tax=Anguilla anguilla TaxID=7936 RepID=A0A0E9XVD4_ANGAN